MLLKMLEFHTSITGKCPNLKSNITRWKQKGEPTQKYRDKWEFRGRFWYEKD